MALTATDQRDIYKLMVGMFNAAPGVDVFGALADIINSGATLDQIYEALSVNPIFTGQDFDYTSGSTEQQFASQFVETLIGDTATQENKDALADAIAGLLDADIITRGQAMKLVIDLLDDIDPSDPDWGAAAQQFDNKITVAIDFTENQNGTADSLEGLQLPLAGVTDDPATVDAAIAGNAGAGGQSFTLTTGEDSGADFTGGTGNDTFNAPAVENNVGDLVQTLQSVDILDGGAGTDALNATISFAFAGPILTDIENVNLRFVDGGTVDLSSSKGITSLTIENSITSASVDGVGSIANFTYKNSNLNTGDGVELGGSTATTLNLTLDTVGNSDNFTYIDFGATADTGQPGATTLNVVTKDAFIDILDDFGTDKLTTVTFAATGENEIDLFFGQSTVTKATVTGTGTLDLRGAAFDGPMTVFDASGNSGGVKVDIQSSKAVAVTGGSGGDTIDMDTTVTTDSTVAAGDGNDKVFVGTLLGSFKSIDGGVGTDIINITDGATLDATTAKIITNIETLDVGGGTGTYDLSLNSFPTVQIDAAVKGALAGDVVLDNAPDSFTLNVASKKATDFATANDITVFLDDPTGTDNFTLNSTIKDGDNDATAEGKVTISATLSVDDFENITINSTVATADTDVKASSYTTTINNLSAADVTTLTLTGDSSISFTTFTGADTITKVDASGDKGNITLNLSAEATKVAYTGSSGVDKYSATDGGNIFAGAGNDKVTLVAANATTARNQDTLIYKAAGDASLKDADANGDIDSVSTMEQVVNFTTAATAAASKTGTVSDLVDVTNFGFTAFQSGVLNKSIIATSAADAPDGGGFSASITNFFADAGGDRGVAFGVADTDNNGVDAGDDTYVFIDANKDGDFTVSGDLVVKLVGVIDFASVDVVT